jgi:hypothetical protein
VIDEDKNLMSSRLIPAGLFQQFNTTEYQVALSLEFVDIRYKALRLETEDRSVLSLAPL